MTMTTKELLALVADLAAADAAYDAQPDSNTELRAARAFAAVENAAYQALPALCAEVEAQAIRIAQQDDALEREQGVREDAQRQLAEMEATIARMREALAKIAEYEGDPLTPVRNSVKKSAIARAALKEPTNV